MTIDTNVLVQVHAPCARSNEPATTHEEWTSPHVSSAIESAAVLNLVFARPGRQIAADHWGTQASAGVLDFIMHSALDSRAGVGEGYLRTAA